MEQHQDLQSIQADHHPSHEIYSYSMDPIKNGYHKQTRCLKAWRTVLVKKTANELLEGDNEVDTV
jgi:hypothetical protein